MLKYKDSDEYFMKEAIKQAREAFVKDEVPIGAVLVYRDEIIARAQVSFAITLNPDLLLFEEE